MRCPLPTLPSRAWVGHPLLPRVLSCGPRWGQARSLPTLREMERKNITGSRGRAISILIDPADTTGNTVLLGGAYGALCKSTNAGSQNSNPALVTWQALIDDQPTLAVGAIALQPGNSNVVLVGTSQITVTATAAGGTSHGDLVTLIVQ